MKDILKYLFTGAILTREEAREALRKVAAQEANPAQVAAFTTVFNMRQINSEELAGFRDTLLDLSIPVPVREFDAMDLCGTGGDGKNSFNVSTCAAFVVAASGQNVVKHGNKSVSSKCGSSDVLAHLGITFTNEIDEIRNSLEEFGLAFLHAPLFHPALKELAPIRKDLGVKTFFNMLGPMVNPANPNKQMVGVFNSELQELYAKIYKADGKEYAIVHSVDGYDEVSLTSAFHMYTHMGEFEIEPEDMGLDRINPESLYGGDTVEEAAEIVVDVLTGNATKEQTNVVLANAAVALHIGLDVGLREGVEMAQEAIESETAYQILKSMRRNTK
jgi:anthranilate phosphoribosyltransferase